MRRSVTAARAPLRAARQCWDSLGRNLFLSLAACAVIAILILGTAPRILVEPLVNLAVPAEREVGSASYSDFSHLAAAQASGDESGGLRAVALLADQSEPASQEPRGPARVRSQKTSSGSASSGKTKTVGDESGSTPGTTNTSPGGGGVSGASGGGTGGTGGSGGSGGGGSGGGGGQGGGSDAPSGSEPPAGGGCIVGNGNGQASGLGQGQGLGPCDNSGKGGG